MQVLPTMTLIDLGCANLKATAAEQAQEMDMLHALLDPEVTRRI